MGQKSKTATIESVTNLNPDVIIAATGSTLSTPHIEGVNNSIVSWLLLDGSAELPQNSRIDGKWLSGNTDYFD